MKNFSFTRFATSKNILSAKYSHVVLNFFRVSALIFLPALFSACGGGKNTKAESPQISSFTASSSSTTSASLGASSSSVSFGADTILPTLSGAKAVVSNDAVVLSVVASDNSGLFSVTFIVDDEAIKADERKDPSESLYSTSFPLWVRGVGTHHFVVVAIDAAGNSISTDKVSFVIESDSNTRVGNAAPTVSNVQVDGNFGVVTLKAIVKDDEKLFDIEFLVDDQPTGWAEHLDTRADAPKDQYYVTFDTYSITSGPHRLVVKARDYDANLTTSEEIIFNVDSTAGLPEIEPNNNIASANVVADNQLQIAGTLKNTKANSRVNADYDYYKILVPAGKTLSVKTLALPSTIFVSILDSNENIISGNIVKMSS
ncbi:MAG TPA: hypothetical protein VL995_14215 [Cellvibrio sp.]|nr:hypothetical protein [Cellvibrio sp.]